MLRFIDISAAYYGCDPDETPPSRCAMIVDTRTDKALHNRVGNHVLNDLNDVAEAAGEWGVGLVPDGFFSVPVAAPTIPAAPAVDRFGPLGPAFRTARANFAGAVVRELRRLRVGQRLAVGPMRMRSLGDAGIDLTADVLVLEPNEAPPLGVEWTVYGPMTPELEALARAGEGEDDATFNERVRSWMLLMR